MRRTRLVRPDHLEWCCKSARRYWKKCWQGSEKIRAIRIEKLFEKGDEAFVHYECELMDGARFRNTEYFRIEGNKIKESRSTSDRP